MTEREIKLPDDVSKYMRHIRFVRFLKLCLVIVPVYLILFNIWSNIRIYRPDAHWFWSICLVAFIILPALCCSRLIAGVFERTYCGRIEKVEITTMYDTVFSFKLVSGFYRNTVYLTVREQNGRTSRNKAYSGDAKYKRHLNTYHTGDAVFHLSGSEVTVKLPAAADKHLHCVVCGALNDITGQVCHECGHTLLKIKTEQ